MLSMTAFCRKQAELEQGTLIWEIRSVNHRYLETSIRLPEAFRNLEPVIRKTVRGRTKRGKIDCTLRFRESDSLPGEMHLNSGILENLAAASEKIHDAYGDSRLPSSLDILRWPGVIQTEANDDSGLEQEAMSLFNGALDEFLAGRAREGEEIETVSCARGSPRSGNTGRSARLDSGDIGRTSGRRCSKTSRQLQVNPRSGKSRAGSGLAVNKADMRRRTRCGSTRPCQ